MQQRVLADGAVLEQRYVFRASPLMVAISNKKPAIALWLIEHRGQHDVNATADGGWTALHWASGNGQLEMMQALVAAGANAAAQSTRGVTPVMQASTCRRTDVVAFLLQLPTVKASIDHINRNQETALSIASADGRQPIVQLLLDAGADPTIPPGEWSPLNQATSNNHHDVAALLRHVIAEAERIRQTVAAVGHNGGLSGDLSLEIATCLLPAWATKGSEA